ncbi:halo transducer protein [Haloferax namakaokahaiae]|uniref:Halo transducer protein n=1 Tax=Haloferax namakaokahaiae TaxID=1748331 RepID=A0ABD5ZFW9_9EURY
MATEKRDTTVEQLIGVAKSAAVDRLVTEDDSRDAEVVGNVLTHVTDDGIITREAIDESVTDTAMILSTAETRVELAGIALEEARERAQSAPDVDSVRARLSAFESVVSGAEAQVESLGETNQRLSAWQRESRSLYELVTGLRDVASGAQQVTRVADDTQLEIEEFETWLTNHASRIRELTGDVDVLEQSLNGISETASQVDDGHASADAWFDASLRLRTVPLSIADARAELDDVRTMAPESASGDEMAEIADRLDSLDGRARAMESELDGVADDAWHEQYGERLESFESTLDSFETPVSWAAVQSELERARQV